MRHLVNRTRSVFVAGFMALALTGCGGKQPETGIIPNEPTVLRVDNQSFNDMRIYVIQGGQRIRVGTANGKNTTSFRLSKSVVTGFTTIKVEAVPIGGNGSSVSEQISIQPGEQLELRITP
jgi:hypothetical protein